MNWKKVAIFAAVALALFLVIAKPGQAAGLVNNVIDTLKDAGNSVIEFVTSI